MNKFSFTSFIRPSEIGPIKFDPMSGKTLCFKAGDDLENNPPIAIEQEWHEKGWIHSLIYIASDRLKNSALPFQDNLPDSPTSKKLLDWTTLSHALLSRKSVRRFSRKQIDSEIYNQLQHELTNFLVQYPYFKVYISPFNVERTEPFLVTLCANKLDVSEYKLARNEACNCIAGMPSSMTSSITLFLTCDFEEAIRVFPENQARLKRIFIEAGSIFQKILTIMSSFEIYGVASPALSDIKSKHSLAIRNEKEWPIYSLALGYKE